MKSLRSLTSTRRGIAIALASAIVFGLWPASARCVYQEGGNSTFAIIVTMWARALAMAGFCFATRRALFVDHGVTRSALFGGVFVAVSMVAAYEALVSIPGPVAIVIISSHSLILLAFLALKGEEKLDFQTLASAVAALGGLTLVLNVWDQKFSLHLSGIGLACLSAFAIACRAYVFGKQTAERHPIVVGAENYLVGALLVTMLSFYELPSAPISLKGHAFAALGALATTLGTFGMFYGISLLGAFRWSLFLKLEPIFTSLFSVILIGEVLKPSQYVGILVVIASLVTYQILDSRRKARFAALKQVVIS